MNSTSISQPAGVVSCSICQKGKVLTVILVRKRKCAFRMNSKSPNYVSYDHRYLLFVSPFSPNPPKMGRYGPGPEWMQNDDFRNPTVRFEGRPLAKLSSGCVRFLGCKFRCHPSYQLSASAAKLPKQERAKMLMPTPPPKVPVGFLQAMMLQSSYLVP